MTNARDAVLFLPTMAALACLAVVGFGAIIIGGNRLLISIFRALVGIGVWKPAALTLSIFATAITVYGTAYSVGRLRRRKR